MEKQSGLYNSIDNNIDVIDIIPFRDEYNIEINSNTVTINGIDNMNNPHYLPNGEYHFSASSVANSSNQPYLAFNNDVQSFWQCDFSGNTDNTISKTYNSYSQNPYQLVSYDKTISPYVGGGDDTNTWTTLINGSQVNGEWLQVQLPYSVYLYEYNILTPSNGSSPFLFAVVGSNDGVNWKYVDQQNAANKDDINTSYRVNSTEKFSYFRLIITEIVGDNPYIQILRWKLKGGTHLNVMVENEQPTQITSVIDIALSTSDFNPIVTNSIGYGVVTQPIGTMGNIRATNAYVPIPTTFGDIIATTIPQKTIKASTTTNPINSIPVTSKSASKIEQFTSLSTENIDKNNGYTPIDKNIKNLDLGYNSNISNTSTSSSNNNSINRYDNVITSLYNDDPIIYISITLGVLTISLYMIYLTKNK